MVHRFNNFLMLRLLTPQLTQHQCMPLPICSILEKRRQDGKKITYVVSTWTEGGSAILAKGGEDTQAREGDEGTEIVAC